MSKGEVEYIPESFINPAWLIPREMKTIGAPAKSEDSQRVRLHQETNASRIVPAEDWMAAHLKDIKLDWRRQYQFGYRIYDFFSPVKGIAVEVDGSTHNNPKQKAWDYIRDEYNFRRSGILVLRVRNYDEDGAKDVIEKIRSALYWKQRRIALGMVGKDRTRLLKK